MSVITEQAVIHRILTHLDLPLRPEQTQDGAVLYDVTGEQVLADAASWEDAYDARGPPSEWDGVHALPPPCADRSPDERPCSRKAAGGPIFENMILPLDDAGSGNQRWLAALCRTGGTHGSFHFYETPL